MWAMEHVLFAQNKLGKTKSCIPRILHWMQVKVGEAEVEKSFSSNEVRLKYVIVITCYLIYISFDIIFVVIVLFFV